MRYLVPYDRNPLVESKLRNFSCPCGSQKKVKKCCGRVAYIPSEYASPLRQWCEQVTEAMGQESPASLRAMLAEYAKKNQNELIVNQAEGAISAE